MKKHLIWMLALSAMTLQAPRAWSQPTIYPSHPAPDPEAEESVLLEIPLQHAPAAAMARWLTQFQLPLLPPGINWQPYPRFSDEARASEDGKSIVVRAPKQHADDMRQVVAALDQPLQHIELELQSVFIDKSDLPLLLPGVPIGSLPEDPHAPATFNMVLIPREVRYLDTLKSLHLRQRVAQAQQRRVTLTANDNTWLGAGNMFEASITTSINADGTLNPVLKMGTLKSTQILILPYFDPQAQTLAILRWHFHESPSHVTVTFLTPRLIRDADEKK